MGLNTPVIDAQIKAALERVDQKNAGKLLRGAAITAFKRVVRETPQWSGYMAENTTIFHNGTPVSSGAIFIRNPPLDDSLDSVYSKGSDPAVAKAIANNKGINSVKVDINDTLSVGYTNTMVYFRLVEDGYSSRTTGLRDVNKPGRAIARAAAYMQSQVRFKHTRLQFALEKL